jgi:hypothetical protein
MLGAIKFYKANLCDRVYRGNRVAKQTRRLSFTVALSMPGPDLASIISSVALRPSRGSRRRSSRLDYSIASQRIVGLSKPVTLLPGHGTLANRPS